MKIRIKVEIGDKIIADTYHEDDAVLVQRKFPRALINQAEQHVWKQMTKAIDRAMEEALVKSRIPTDTSYPPKRDGHPYDQRFDVA